VPFIRPYRVRSDIQSWMNDPSIQELIESEYKRGYYAGIGEFHLSGKAAATEWVKRTVDFAGSRDLFLHAHADDEALEILFAHNPKAKIIWAHTGFSTPPAKVEAYLKRYPALWCELSYRYGITSGNTISPEWKSLFERYPDRFLLGSDTWVNERWDSYGAIMAEYRHWLAQLPKDVAERIAFRNAEALFKR
jgi:predicted TIM-barrel fold metal-dependent hydrolase